MQYSKFSINTETGFVSEEVIHHTFKFYDPPTLLRRCKSEMNLEDFPQQKKLNSLDSRLAGG